MTDDQITRDRAVLRPTNIEATSAGSSFFASGTAGHIDDVDQALISYLLEDGKTTNRELAQRIGISESGVSTRLRKLTSSGVLVFTAVIDWEVAGFDWFVICRIKTRSRPPQDVAADIARLRQCEAVAVVLGSHNVLGYFLVKDRTELSATVDQIATIEGVAEMDVEMATDTVVNRQGSQLFLARNAPPIRLPAPRIDLDDLDITILQALIDDGRQSSRNIARAFDVSEGTVRARISRMTQSGLARVVAMVQPLALGLAGVIACVSVKAERQHLPAIIDHAMAMPNVVFSAVCVGGWDMHVALTATDLPQLMELIGSEVQSLDGVLATDTLLMVDVIRFSPFMKRLGAAD